MSPSMLKCLAVVTLLLSIFCGVRGDAAHPCDTNDSGNWCYSTGYVTCPSYNVRPCQSGLVCQQQSIAGALLGEVYCVRPSELLSTSSSASATATAAPTQKATQRPTPAPTQASATTHKGHATPAPTTRPTRPTAAATERPATPAPTAAPTKSATAAPTKSATAAPTNPPVNGAGSGTSGSWPNGPVKAIYIDNYCWDASFSFNQLVDAGYNLIILAFFVNSVSWDCTIAWGSMSEATQLSTIAYAHSKGARIIASTGGSTDSPYGLVTGSAYGSSVARWVANNHLDGMDFDLENFGRNFAFGALSTTQTVQWVADATNAARTILGSSAIITHAPQPPYFGANSGWDDGYTKIYKLAPSINFFLVQFYNNGPTNTYESMFLNNANGGSVTSMVAGGIPMNKIVIGKPVHANDIGDVTQGYNTAAEMHSIVTQAKSELGWNAGVMGWQWTGTQDSAWINTIYPN